MHLSAKACAMSLNGVQMVLKFVVCWYTCIFWPN